MRLPWLRRNFLARRRLDRIFLDAPDAILRRLTGRGHWPPYSLRAFVGGAQNFDEVGTWFLGECRRFGLFGSGARILDIGCGCGRLAYTLAVDQDLRAAEVEYRGMDVDRDCVSWCQAHITPHNSRFRFYHSDRYSSSYNPRGTEGAYVFPHPSESFDLVLMTSVLTHLLETELFEYLSEVSRLLAPGGVAYASLFLFDTLQQAAAGMPRHGIDFRFGHGHYALNREDHPANAVAYDEAFIRTALTRCGLEVIEPTRYGLQDVLLLTRIQDPAGQVELGEGWHPLELAIWRWTERVFSASLPWPEPSPKTLRFRFILPERLLQQTGPVWLRVSAGGCELPPQEFRNPGEHCYLQPVPLAARSGATTPFLFQIGSEDAACQIDGRELGVQVIFASNFEHTQRVHYPMVLEGLQLPI